MTDTPDEVVEVATAGIRGDLTFSGLIDAAGYNGAAAAHAAEALTQAALTALQSAGYVVAKPFWPPGEVEEATKAIGVRFDPDAQKVTY